MKPNGFFSTCKLQYQSPQQLPPFMTRGATPFTLHPLSFNRLHFPSKTTTTTSSLTTASSSTATATGRRRVLLAPLIATGAAFLLSSSSKADEAKTNSTPPPPPQQPPPQPPPSLAAAEEEEAGIGWRIYDATAIGEPMAVGKEKRRGVWEKVMNSRVVYLGEAEQVPTKDDKVLELEILKGLTKRCVESEKSVSLALEAFPSDLQPQLDQFLDKRWCLAVD